MSQAAHTYGPTCHHAKSVAFSGAKSDDDIPDLTAQFFYRSALPIDDPLSAAPTPTSSEATVEHPPRPFSGYDNNALEEAWLGCRTDKDSKNHNKGKARKPSRPPQNDRPSSSIGTLFSAKHKKPSTEGSGNSRSNTAAPTSQASNNSASKRTKATKTTSFSTDGANSDAPPYPTIGCGKAKHSIRASSTIDNGDKAVHVKRDKKTDRESRLKTDGSGNPYNPNCDDSEHVVLDLDAPECCSTLEDAADAKSLKSHRGRIEASHDNTGLRASKKETSPKDKKAKLEEPASMGHRPGPGQGDATDDSMIPKIACSFKECDPSNPPEKQNEQCDLSSKVHASLNKHENSKSHQNFAKHLSANHPADKLLDKKPKSAKKEPEGSVKAKKSEVKSSGSVDKNLKTEEKKLEAHPSEGPETKWKLFEKKISQIAHDKKTDVHPSDSADKRLKPSGRSRSPSPHEKRSDAPSSESADRKLKLFEKSRSPSPHGKKRDGQSSEAGETQPKVFEKKVKPFEDKKTDAKAAEPTPKKTKQSDKTAALSPATQLSDLHNRPEHGNVTGTTGLPFLKLPSRPTTPQPPVLDKASPEAGSNNPQDDQCVGEDCRKRTERDSTETESLPDHKCKAGMNTKDHVDVPVGVCKLHKVVLPALQMEPIYWSPVHDLAPVIRGTWFYKNSMYPVECSVANQLETGYRELRPWSQTWKDELHSANEVGAVGEEKISHDLWPKDQDRHNSSVILSTDPYCAARCFRGEAAAEGTLDMHESAKKTSDVNSIVKKYPNAQVIYKDAKNAYILKPALHPSAYHKRRPLSKIRKGIPVGIHVVRGFDWSAWENLHPSKKSNFAVKVDQQAAASGDANLGKRNACEACRLQYEERPKVTDLVLVIHGIGQKLSERVESFHFTHAVNAFRRDVNAELCNDAVKKAFRNDLGGVMVLPVNWRSSLSFEDGDTLKDGENDRSVSDFSLKDITPTTIPAVRSLISDVMLDIPYYMSNNKAKMIQAAINEANRVYRLWCKNNPDFHEKGQVHIIAHSLGSVMAMEILSKQPTLVPRVDFHGKKINTKHFDFNTKNLFCAGCPAGFFLLLEKAKLIPRKGQGKPGAEVGDDKDKSIVGDAGTFGCLAVDNIYNIMHQNDPIAYRLNACADPQYAASLKTAYVPSATVGFFETIGNAVKSMTPGLNTPADIAVGQIPKPAAISRLPSQLEMDVHDFSAEDRAERMFYLLNDNCQVDWVMSSGGGPLEIQYLNMLGAHSSYWSSPGFIRFIVIEVGRKPGRTNALPNMRAVKTVKTRQKV